MQNRYTGDAGDFGKFGLLRALVGEDSALRLGLIWYLYPNEGHNADGKHTGYLESSTKNDRNFRVCDPDLYDALRALVEANDRDVAAIPKLHILPPATVYFEEPLDFQAMPNGLLAAREAWLARALNATTSCDIVMLDPDNGLECSVAKRNRKAGKYVYLDEITPMLARGQSVVLYQHLDRSATAPIQIERRARLMTECLGLACPPIALRHRSGTSRVYYFISQPRHVEAVRCAIEKLTAEPWSRHFTLAELLDA